MLVKDEAQEGATIIHHDSDLATTISKNLIFHLKTKHIKIKYYFVKEAQNTSQVKLVKADGKD